MQYKMKLSMVPRRPPYEMGRNVLSLTVLLLGISFGCVIALTTLTCLLESEKREVIWKRPYVHQNTNIEEMEVQDNITKTIYDNVRVLCWVMTNPKNHWIKAQFSKRTWGKHCNILLFMSSETDPVLGTVALPVGEGREHLWYKVRAAFRHIHKHYINEADFFMKADDDSFVITENLRMLLSKHSPNAPNWFGCRFHLPQQHDQGYMSGGSGYVLSREALRRFVEIALPNKDICFPDEVENEDIEVGRCLQNVNVTAVDTRDSHLKGTFMPFNPESHLHPPEMSDYWYWIYRFYGNANDTKDNCSSAAVAFHYIPPYDMVMMNYLIYNLSTYGIKDTFLSTTEKRYWD